MSVLCILPGPPKDLVCPCCGEHQADGDAFASRTCWPCSFGEHPECVSCVERGVPFNRFGTPLWRAKMHRLREPLSDQAVAVCGFRVPRSDCGAGTAVIFRYCKHCWGDE